MSVYIYGKNVVKQRINSRKNIKKLMLNKDNPDRELEKLAKMIGCEIKYCSSSELDGIYLGNQGVIAEIEEYKVFSLEEVLNNIGRLSTVVILDCLEDPHNLGAILRTADATGVDAVIIPKNNSVSLNATVAKVSTGAIETVKTVVVTNISQTIETLKKNEFWVYASELTDKSVDYRSVDYTGRVAIVIGSEGKGISRLVLKNCDQVISIPMVGVINSLNASVSAALLMYEILNQRNPVKNQ